MGGGVPFRPNRFCCQHQQLFLAASIPFREPRGINGSVGGAAATPCVRHRNEKNTLIDVQAGRGSVHRVPRRFSLDS